MAARFRSPCSISNTCDTLRRQAYGRQFLHVCPAGGVHAMCRYRTLWYSFRRLMHAQGFASCRLESDRRHSHVQASSHVPASSDERISRRNLPSSVTDRFCASLVLISDVLSAEEFTITVASSTIVYHFFVWLILRRACCNPHKCGKPLFFRTFPFGLTSTLSCRVLLVDTGCPLGHQTPLQPPEPQTRYLPPEVGWKYPIVARTGT